MMHKARSEPNLKKYKLKVWLHIIAMQEVTRLQPLLLLLLPVLLQQPCPAAALNNGRLRTPPLGFSDACLGGGENTRLSAAQMQVVADGFISTGLAALGYTRMNFDDR